MQTHVYANGREICSQAADGKSAAAFPDVCWSPPGPPAGPVQLPYPNTAFAKDLANGTTTVFICGTAVARKDESYFSTSTGNEPATTQFPKGINTGALTGKAYFTSWSMNVMVEGLNVTRHQDLMTHNHASPGGQTPPQVYFDDAGKSKIACKNELKKIKEECGPEPDPKNPSMGKARRGALKKITDKINKLKSKSKDKYDKSDDNDWMEHCDGLWIKPHTSYRNEIEQFAQQIEHIQKDLVGSVADIIKPTLDSLERALLDRIKQEALDRGTKLGLRTAARWGAGAAGLAFAGVGAIVTEVVATGWNIYDLAMTGYEGYQLGKEVMGQLDEIKSVMGDFDGAMEKLKGAWQKAISNPQQAMAEGMSIFAELNSCTRARRCILVPYKNTSSLTSLGGHGCCPGQTGHHVLPDEMTKGACPGYNKLEAPTVCVEGVTNTHGSHGRIHDKLLNDVENHKALPPPAGGETMSYTKARNMGIASINHTFGVPGSKCSPKCLEAQLDAYYEKKCTGPVPAKAGKRAPNVEDELV